MGSTRGLALGPLGDEFLRRGRDEQGSPARAVFEADIARTGLRFGYEPSRDGRGPLEDFSWAREAWARRELDQDVYVEAALAALVEAGLGLGMGGAESKGGLESSRWKRAVDRCEVPTIESFGVEVGAGLRRMGVHRLCDLEGVDLVEIERVNEQRYLGAGEIDMNSSEEVPRLWAPRGPFVTPEPVARPHGTEPVLINGVEMLNRVFGGGECHLNEADMREMERVIRDIKKSRGWDHLLERARDGVVSTRHASEAALLGGPVGARIVRVFAWKAVGDGDRWLAQTEREYSLWSHGEWRSWEEIERLVKKSSLGEVETEHVREACNWAREHRPIPVDFATFLQSHMTLDDIKRVVARREKEGLSEEERDKIDQAKVRATRLMVDVYAPRKQFPFIREVEQ